MFYIAYLNFRKKSLISSVYNTGSSMAVKWPPLGITFQCKIFNNFLSAHARGGLKLSPGYKETPAGT
jgi:hypothetical protein